jgi:hypothetical protein
VQPAQPSDSFLANSNDLLHFPGLSAQLDIWSNLAFESDEPLVRKSDKKSGGEVDESTLSVEDEDEDDADDGQPARADNHDNVVMGNPIIPTPPAQPPVASRAPLNAFDIGSLLAGFGIDPFMASSVQSTSATPSLAQILSLYPNAALPPLPPASTESTPPAAKRSRTRTRVSSISASVGDQSSDAASPAAVPAMTPLTPRKNFMGQNIVVEFAKESRPRREPYEDRHGYLSSLLEPFCPYAHVEVGPLFVLADPLVSGSWFRVSPEILVGRYEDLHLLPAQ